MEIYVAGLKLQTTDNIFPKGNMEKWRHLDTFNWIWSEMLADQFWFWQQFWSG